MSFVIGTGPDHVRVVGRSMVTLDETRRHFAELEQVVSGLRREGRPVRVIVDLREAAPPPREVIGFIKGRIDTFYHPSDRVALVVDAFLSPADKEYLRTEQKFGVFHTELAAEEFAFRHAPAERLPGDELGERATDPS